MNSLVITSRQNKFVKMVRSLRDKNYRTETGLFLVDGMKMLMEAVNSGIKVVNLVVSEDLIKKDAVPEELLREHEANITVVDGQVMEYISETMSPQGIIGVMALFDTKLEQLSCNEDSFFVVLDTIQDPGNLGTIVRTADAFGASAILATKGSADLFNNKTLRATMGSAFHIPFIGNLTQEEIVAFLKGHGVQMAAANLSDDATPIAKADLKRPFALLLGNEGNGLSPEFLEAAEQQVIIPMVGQTESLNVAISAAIMLYEVTRTRVVDL